MPKALIGMLHAPPLPGAPGYGGDLAVVRRRVLEDAEALVGGGVRSLMIENFGDAPFYPGSVPPHVVAHIAALGAEVRARFGGVALGINVLRNDGCAALSIAHAVGADFIRVNVLCGARLTDQGIVQGAAHELLRLRKILGAERIRILADVDVKHSAPLAAVPLEQEVEDLIHRGRADGLIVTGPGTGKAAAADQLARVKGVADGVPVFIGSGVTPQRLADYAPHADGFVVGSWLKRDGSAENPVDRRRVAELVRAVDGLG